MKSENIYYVATAQSSFRADLITNCEQVDVCVIGAGFAGLSAALGLVEKGISNVALIEKQRVGYGASGRNGGFVFGGFSLAEEQLVKILGMDKAKKLYQLTKNGVELIRHRIQNYPLDCDYVGGGVILANWFNDDKRLLEKQQFMRKYMDVDWEYIDQSSLRQLLDTERYFGGLMEPDAFHFHPLNYALGIAKKIQEFGGKVIENEEVISVAKDGDSWLIKTNTSALRADQVVISCGGYMDKFYPKIANSALAIATYVMTTEEIPNIKKIINTQAAVYDTRFAFDYYRVLNNKRLLWGGRISIKSLPPQEIQKLLYKDLVRVFPQLSEVKIDFSWQGLMCYPVHKMPIIGEIKPGLWHAYGFGGHGVATSNIGGELIARAIAKQDGAYQLFSPFDMQYAWGSLGKIAAQLSYWYLQARDRMDEIRFS